MLAEQRCRRGWCWSATRPASATRPRRTSTLEDAAVAATALRARRWSGSRDRPSRVPAMANAHSHAFQRDLRGRGRAAGPGARDDDFWSWREAMYALAGALDPDSHARGRARASTARWRRAGYGAVGEFHYVHHRPDGTPYEDPNAMAIARRRGGGRGRAGDRAAPGRLPPRRLGGGDRRRRPASGASATRTSRRSSRASTRCARGRHGRPGVAVGVAAHSVRAVPADWLEAIAALRRRARPRPPRPRARAAARARRVPGRARLLADRAARAHRLPRPADERRARHPRDRARHRAARATRARSS